ncbi:hypothetical protein CL658_05725 [bacterium]|nr:hypothetical protein [bacterium]
MPYYIMSLILLFSSIIQANPIMQYPNALNRETLQSIQQNLNKNKKIMTIFESNTYSIETIKTILQNYDPNLFIITKKETGKLVILHHENQKETLKKMLQQLNLLPIKIQIDCYIFEINKEYEKELNLINSPLEDGTAINYKNLDSLAEKVSLLDTIKTLEKQGQASLIAHPQFKIENGKTASLIIGEKLPYITSIINTTSTSQSLHHVQTGLNISIQATALSETQLQCLIQCDLSNVKLWKTIQNNTYPILGSRTLNIETILDINQASLITQFTDSISKTYQSNNPFLKRIPFLKKLTGINTQKTKKTKLCIILKPTLLKN